MRPLPTRQLHHWRDRHSISMEHTAKLLGESLLTIRQLDYEEIAPALEQRLRYLDMMLAGTMEEATATLKKYRKKHYENYA